MLSARNMHGFPICNYVLEVIVYPQWHNIQNLQRSNISGLNYRRITKPRTSINSTLICAGKNPPSVPQPPRLAVCYRRRSNRLRAVCCCSLLLSIAGGKDSRDEEMATWRKYILVFREKQNADTEEYKIASIAVLRISEKHQWTHGNNAVPHWFPATWLSR